MVKFHTNDQGVISPCSASVRSCRYGGSEVHFDSMEVAVLAIELSNYGGQYFFDEKSKLTTEWQVSAKRLPPIPDTVNVLQALRAAWVTDPEDIRDNDEDGPYWHVLKAQDILIDLEGNPEWEDYGGIGLDDEFDDVASSLDPRRTLVTEDKRYIQRYFPRFFDAYVRDSAVAEILQVADLGLPALQTAARGGEVYVHPQGKQIVVEADGSLTVTKDGKRASSGATLADLRAGRGRWKRQ